MIPTKFKERVAAGLCGNPRCSRPCQGGFTTCHYHRRYYREHQKLFYHARTSAGLCRACGAPMSDESGNFCEEHHERQNRQWREWKARRRGEGGFGQTL